MLFGEQLSLYDDEPYMFTARQGGAGGSVTASFDALDAKRIDLFSGATGDGQSFSGAAGGVSLTANIFHAGKGYELNAYKNSASGTFAPSLAVESGYVFDLTGA